MHISQLVFRFTIHEKRRRWRRLQSIQRERRKRIVRSRWVISDGSEAVVVGAWQADTITSFITYLGKPETSINKEDQCPPLTSANGHHRRRRHATAWAPTLLFSNLMDLFAVKPDEVTAYDGQENFHGRRPTVLCHCLLAIKRVCAAPVPGNSVRNRFHPNKSIGLWSISQRLWIGLDRVEPAARNWSQCSESSWAESVQRHRNGSTATKSSLWHHTAYSSQDDHAKSELMVQNAALISCWLKIHCQFLRILVDSLPTAKYVGWRH